jgi:3-dehydroquinate dehydratase
MPGIGSKRKRVCQRMREAEAEKKLRLETAVSESRSDVQDDIQATDEQQEEEIWINPGMKGHPVAHWMG